MCSKTCIYVIQIQTSDILLLTSAATVIKFCFLQGRTCSYLLKNQFPSLRGEKTAVLLLSSDRKHCWTSALSIYPGFPPHPPGLLLLLLLLSKILMTLLNMCWWSFWGFGMVTAPLLFCEFSNLPVSLNDYYVFKSTLKQITLTPVRPHPPSVTW